MINKTQPPSGVFQKHISPFLTRLAPFMVKHVFRFKRLIDGQINRIIRIGDAPRSIDRWLDDIVHFVYFFVDHLVSQYFFLFFFFARSLDGGRHPPVVRFAVARGARAAEAMQEWEFFAVVFIFATCLFAP